MAILIAVDGTVSTVVPSNGKAFSLAEMRHNIGGGFVERIPYPIPLGIFPHNAKGKRLSGAWCDEEGLLKKMPANEKASRLFRHPIVGPVLLTYPGEVE